jgi:hypothetical protein
MPLHRAYTGPHRKLLLAIDVGTTYSGISYKGVPGFHAMTQGRGGGGSRGLKNIFYRGHILCILVHLEIELSHLGKLKDCWHFDTI